MSRRRAPEGARDPRWNAMCYSSGTMRSRGFTLVETLMSLALMGLTLSSALFVLGRFNDFARSNRLSTCAQAVAQSQIDLLLNARFTPQANDVPAILALGTQAQSDVPIYTDPQSGDALTGTVTTTITDASRTLDGKTLDLRRATVEVTYLYRSRPRSVIMETMRASDL